MTFMITQQRTHTICNPKLIAIFSRLEKKIKRTNQIARMRNSIISLDKGNSSDRGYNCEAELSCEHFCTIYDSRVHEIFSPRASKYGYFRKWLLPTAFDKREILEICVGIWAISHALYKIFAFVKATEQEQK